MTPAEIMVALAEKVARESTDPREEIRCKAEKRVLAAFEALSGVSWISYRQLRLVLGVMAAAANPHERELATAALPSSEPKLTGHEAEITAAIDGCAGGKRVWPPLFDLLKCADLLGGITNSDHLKQKFMRLTAKMTEDDRAFFGR